MTMSKDEILGRIQTILGEMFEMDPAKITTDAQLIKDLDLDSIDAIDLVVKLQDITGKRVPEERLRKLRTVGDVVDLVAEQLSEGPDLRPEA